MAVFCCRCCRAPLHWLFSLQSCCCCCDSPSPVSSDGEKFHLRKKNPSFKAVSRNSHQHFLVLHFPMSFSCPFLSRFLACIIIFLFRSFLFLSYPFSFNSFPLASSPFYFLHFLSLSLLPSQVHIPYFLSL